MATRWQQLGGFVGAAENLSYQQLEKFRNVGGRWIVVLVDQVGYAWNHDPAVVHNIARLFELQQWCEELGVALGGWFNCWAGGELHLTPADEADEIARKVKGFNLMPVVLNCEYAYKRKPQALPQLLSEVRKRITTRSIGISTNEPNDSLIWNGGSLGYLKSCWNLNIRMQPQWYYAPPYMNSMWHRADQTMEWLKSYGMIDNFYDFTAPADRAVPLSYVHGTVEVTGLEGADMAASIEELKRAKQYGYTTGFQIYLLEQMPQSDFDLLASVRGILFQV